MNKIIILAASLLICYTSMAKDEGANVPSTLKSVIVYRSGAEMTHTASAFLKQGDNFITIEDISNQIDINSIQIKTPATVTILGVEFSNNYLASTEKSPREKLLEDSLEHLQQETDRVDLSITNTSELLDVLKDNRNIKGAQNGLSVAELMKLMDYYKIKSLELQTTLQELHSKKNKLNGLANKIKNQIEEEEKKNIITSGRLVLQLSAAAEGKCDLIISYIAQNAYWKPYYDVRVENIASPLKLVYKAKVVQTTGIDWKQVKLSLATSMPSQWGNAPILNSWFLAYIDPVVVMNKNLAANSIQAFAPVEKLDEVVVIGYGTAKKKELTGAVSGVDARDFRKPVYIVNGMPMSEEDFVKINANAIKSEQVLKGEDATSIYGSQAANGAIIVTLKSGLEDYISVANNALNVTFDIDVPYDIPTNGKEQTATLQTIDLPALYKHYAVPKLDKDAYLLAEVPGWEKLNLLPGDANIIFEDTYIGKSFIDPNSTVDTLNLTLGRDERVSIKREKLVDFSSVKFLGSNKLQKFTYEITLKNNKSETVNLLLKDQFPLSTNKDIEVTLVDAGDAEVNNEIGVLNWKLTLAPNEIRKVKFAYAIKYPKDKTVNLN